MKVYIAGVVSNGGVFPLAIQRRNSKRFDMAEKRLRDAGYEPVNPIKLKPINLENSKSWLKTMKFDLKALLDCDAVYALDGWELSSGATIEVELAQKLGMPVYFEGSL